MGRLKCGLMREPHVAACLVPLEQCMDLQAATTALREKVGNDCGLGTTGLFALRYARRKSPPFSAV